MVLAKHYSQYPLIRTLKGSKILSGSEVHGTKNSLELENVPVIGSLNQRITMYKLYAVPVSVCSTCEDMHYL